MVREGGPPTTLQRWCNEKEVVGGLPSQTMTRIREFSGMFLNRSAFADHDIFLGMRVLSLAEEPLSPDARFSFIFRLFLVNCGACA
jgi:hypothetical protein